MATQTEDQAWLDELSKQNNGLKIGETDLANLQGKNEEDRAQFQADLTKQYGERAADKPGSVQYSTPSQAWNSGGSGGGGIFPDWYKELMTRQVANQEADRVQAKGRADSLYSTLTDRANQGLNVNANDPIIKGQVDNFAAAQERSRRGYLSDVAEASGPFANLRGEQRMTAEKAGQGTAGFQAELLARELGSRRDEISNALAQQGGILSGDQNRNLQLQLGQMGQALGEANANISNKSVDNQFSLGNRGLDIQQMLGMGNLALGNRGLDQSGDQFLRELALRQWQLGDQSNQAWAGL